MREPAFWWRESSIAAMLLAPLGALYGAVAGARMRQTGTRAAVPVICAGNLTLGGSGKTPTVMAIAKLLAASGARPFFLTRGYGGQLAGPLQVGAQANAIDIGDEPLLLARTAPTIVSRERVAGAAMARANGAGVVIMDDGLQNPSLDKDLVLAVIDGRRGVGNGHVFPAGPLRAQLRTQLDFVDALIVVGEPSPNARAVIAEFSGATFHARLVPDETAAATLRGKNVLAFAGIGDPEKFFATLDAAGIAAPVRRGFPDHHRYSANEASELLAQAERDNLLLLTTEKDLARMTGDPALADLAARTQALPVTLHFDDEAGFAEFLRRTITR